MRLKTLIQLASKSQEIDLKRCQPGPEFDNVQATCSTLNTADDSLPATKSIREVGLAKALPHTAIAQEFEENVVVAAVN